MSFLTKNNSADNQKNTTSSQIKIEANNQRQMSNLRKQIDQWKEKAHQAFLQVIQIQSLHDQQINQLRAQHNLSIQSLTKNYESLQLKHQKSEQNAQNIFKNYNHNMYQFQKCLQMDSMDMINCRQQLKSQISQISFLKEMQNSCSYDQKILSVKKQVIDVMEKYLQKEGQQVLQKMIGKIFQFIEQLKNDFMTLHQHNYQLLKVNSQIQQKSKNSKNVFQSLKKQSEFMAAHIKKISSQKSKLQKSVAELQRQKKIINEEMQRYKKFSMKSIESTKNMQVKQSNNLLVDKILNQQQIAEEDDSINITQLIHDMKQEGQIKYKKTYQRTNFNFADNKLTKTESLASELKKPFSKQRQPYSKFRSKNLN